MQPPDFTRDELYLINHYCRDTASIQKDQMASELSLWIPIFAIGGYGLYAAIPWLVGIGVILLGWFKLREFFQSRKSTPHIAGIVQKYEMFLAQSQGTKGS